jgi:hypothetical protein
MTKTGFELKVDSRPQILDFPNVSGCISVGAKDLRSAMDWMPVFPEIHKLQP